MQNLALAVFPMVTGVIYEHVLENSDNDNFTAFFYQGIFFVCMSFLCFFISVFLYYYDRKS